MGPNSFAQKFTHYPTITIRFASLLKLINQSNSRITGELPVVSKLGNYRLVQKRRERERVQKVPIESGNIHHLSGPLHICINLKG